MIILSKKLFTLKKCLLFLIICSGIDIQFAAAQTREDNKVHFSVEKSAVFPGGMNNFYLFLRYNYHYSGNEKGRVIVQFIVEKDGSLDSIKVVRGLSAGADKEALRVISLSPNWDPGFIKDKPVRQQYAVPIVVNFYK